MGGLRGFLKKNPLAGWALVILLVAVVGYIIFGQLTPGPRAASVPQPGGNAEPIAPLPSAPAGGAAAPAGGAPPATVAQATRPTATPSPAAGVQPKPAGGAAAPAPGGKVVVSSVIGPGPVGRPDPFSPLVRPPTGREVPPPPLVTLPPPPLPAPGTVPPGGPATAPPTPPTPSSGIAVIGIVGDTASVSIVVINGRSEILSEGDAVGNLRVVKIDAEHRLVRFSRDGTQFDVRMGGE